MIQWMSILIIDIHSRNLESGLNFERSEESISPSHLERICRHHGVETLSKNKWARVSVWKRFQWSLHRDFRSKFWCSGRPLWWFVWTLKIQILDFALQHLTVCSHRGDFRNAIPTMDAVKWLQSLRSSMFLENQFCNLLMIAFIQQSLLLSVNSSAESSTESSEATPQWIGEFTEFNSPNCRLKW